MTTNKRSSALAQKPQRECLPESRHPLRELMIHLPRLKVSEQGELDLLAAPPSLLLTLAENAEEAAACITRGTSAIGSMIAHCTLEIEDGVLGHDAVEALGWMLSELGAVGSECITLAMQCRRAKGAQSRVGD